MYYATLLDHHHLICRAIKLVVELDFLEQWWIEPCVKDQTVVFVQKLCSELSLLKFWITFLHTYMSLWCLL